ncbi:MAG: formyltetrahydrofolate deformylase [Actinomycetota bacterium]
MTTAVFLITCPDRPGLVAAVANFVAGHGGNILHADQHTDAAPGVFFQRVEFVLDGFPLAREEIAPAFAPVAASLGMQVQVAFGDEVPRLAVLASREPHCLTDLLARNAAGELSADIRVVASNHPDHRATTEFYGVPYHYLPVTPDTKAHQEAELAALLAAEGIDLVVLARYMQVLSDDFVARYPNRIINIHHSFLPAFVGARPYHQAHARGVKVIGVTAHYATSALDEGPIIDQDVVRISHRDSVDDLVRKGRDLEKVVLARAIRAHVEHRVLVFGNKTVVFD